MDESLSVQMVREKIGILWKKQCHLRTRIAGGSLFRRQNGEYNEKI